MDPYLEAHDLWRGVHTKLINGVQEDLQPQLRPRYVAMIEERVLLAPLNQGIIPDVMVIKEPAWGLPQPLGGGGVAVMERTLPVGIAEPERIVVPEWEIRHRYLEIRDVRDREVVTVIEVFSPWNKTPGRGRDKYQEKQEEVLFSDANLVEIDLLRGGQPTLAVPAFRLGPSDYRVCIHRVEHSQTFEVFRLSVRDPLPNVGIPLRSGEPDVVLHLQEVLTRCYDNGAYDLTIDYTEEPDPPFAPEDAAWADALLRERGLRGAGKDERP
jgi:hypothetical protein